MPRKMRGAERLRPPLRMVWRSQGGWPKIQQPLFDYSAVFGALVLGCFLYLLACANNFALHLVFFEAHILGCKNPPRNPPPPMSRHLTILFDESAGHLFRWCTGSHSPVDGTWLPPRPFRPVFLISSDSHLNRHCAGQYRSVRSRSLASRAGCRASAPLSRPVAGSSHRWPPVQCQNFHCVTAFFNAFL